EIDAESLTQSYKTISNADNLALSSASSAWASPKGVLSADDITSQSRYFTAMGDDISSSQRFTSQNTSNATLPRFYSISSDSSPTLVSMDNDFESKDEQTLNDKTSSTYRNKVYDGKERRSSMTLSTNSFISAVSEHEDLDLVDLRNQLEK